MSEAQHHEMTEVQPLVVELQSDWGKLFEDGVGSDVDILVGTDRIAVHSLVLKVRCKKLGEDLKTMDSDNCNRPVLSFPSLSPSAVRIVLRYLYTAEITSTDIFDTCQVLFVCYAFGLQSLRSYLLHNLNTLLSVENVCTLLAAAHELKASDSLLGDLKTDLETVANVCMEYIEGNISAVLQSDCEGLLCLERESLVRILSSDKVAVDTDEVVRAVVKWGRRKVGVSKSFLNWDEEEKKKVQDMVEQLLEEVNYELVHYTEKTGLLELMESTDECDSAVCHSVNEFQQSVLLHGRSDLQAQLHEWCGSPAGGWLLVYRGSRDGYAAKDFHKNCDNVGPSLVVARSTDGCVFGGYTDALWSSSHRRGKFSRSHNSFLFSLIHLSNTPPIKLAITQPAYAINNHPNNGPIFGAGADLCICSNSHESENSYCQLGCSYDNSVFPSLTLAGSKYFALDDYEVYRAQ